MRQHFRKVDIGCELNRRRVEAQRQPLANCTVFERIVGTRESTAWIWSEIGIPGRRATPGEQYRQNDYGRRKSQRPPPGHRRDASPAMRRAIETAGVQLIFNDEGEARGITFDGTAGALS